MAEKNIYDLLNDVKTDFNEYEDLTLSSEETSQIQTRLLQEVKKMKKENRAGRHTLSRRKKTGIAAAAACAVVLVTVSSQTSAKELLSSTFQKMIAGSADDKYADEYRELYTKIGKESVSVASDTGKKAAEDTKKQITSATDAGVTVRASDVYCDGYMLYYTLVLETDNKVLTDNAVDFIMTDPIKDRPHCSVSIDGEDEGRNLLVFYRQDDGTFTSLQNYCLYTQQEPKNYADGDQIPIDISIQQLIGIDQDRHDKDGQYVMTEPAKGEWNLSILADVDTAGNHTQKLDLEDNGVKLKSATTAKATLNLVLEEPDFTAEPYNDPYNDPDIAVMDKNGEFLQWAEGHDEIQEDGSHKHFITLIDTGEESYVLEVTNKNVDNETIARIEFPVER